MQEHALWEQVAQWCAPFPILKCYNTFGFVMIAVYSETGKYCYSVSPCTLDEVSTLSQNEFLARLNFRRACEEIPKIAAWERRILLPGAGLLGVYRQWYWEDAQTLDDAMAHLLAEPEAQSLTPGTWFLAYRRIRAPHAVGWTMRKWALVLYTGPNPFNAPCYHCVGSL